MSTNSISPASKNHGMPRVPTVQLPSYLRSIGGALVLEIVIVVIAAVVLLHKHEHVEKPPIMLAIDEPVLDKPKEQPKPKVEPKVKLKPVSQPPRPQPMTPPPPQPIPPEVKPLSTPEPMAEHVDPPKPPPPPPPVDETAAQKAAMDFYSRLEAAIQASAHQLYPQSARLMNIEGRTRVQFMFHDDGTASDAKMLVSSGNAAIDRAALAAVSVAVYPKPPKELLGKIRLTELWVNFTLTPSN